jgi:hypothetical protein
VLAVKDGHGRLRWQQARRQSQLAGGLPRGAVTVLQAGTLRCHQLFFDRMKGRRAGGPARQYSRRGAPRKPPPVPASPPAVRWLQPRLSGTGKDFTRSRRGHRRRPAQPAAHPGDLPGPPAR